MTQLPFSSLDVSKEGQKEIAKLDKLAEETGKIIYELSSVFPFDIFQDKIIIDENKVTVVRRDFLYKRITPIDYSDILTVRVSRSILFAALNFEIKRSRFGSIFINYLNPRKATLAKDYIIGILTAKKANIDFSKLTTYAIKKKLKEIGSGVDEATTLF